MLVALHPGVHVGGQTLNQPRQIAPLGGGPIGHQFADLRLERLIDDGDDLAAGPGHLRFAHALVARAGASRHQAEFIELTGFEQDGDGGGVTARLAKGDDTTTVWAR